MSPALIAVLGFLLLNAAFALRANRFPDAAGFGLDGRSLSGLRLMATLAASNLSAFTIFGVSGAAYRSGWAFFPVMAFGTAFMALSFLLIGVPLRRLSAQRGWVVPGDIVRDRFDSPALGSALTVLLLLYTVPYLAIQAGSAGQTLAQASGLPPWLGSALVSGSIALYVARGGMKAVARTDILQLAVLAGLAVAAAILVYKAFSAEAFKELARADVSVGLRSGSDGSLPWRSLVGYYVLWGLADPMFPHFIQRFFAARSDRDLLRSMALYPLVCLAVFFSVSAIGVMGRTLLPGLSAAQSDGVFTLLSSRVSGTIVGALFPLAALAALMSTMDSQLLSCASMVVAMFRRKKRVPITSADAAEAARRPAAGINGDGRAGSVALAASVLALLAWLVALKPPASILSFLNRTAFPGYASLAPAVLAALYAPSMGKAPVWAALVSGTGLVALEAFGVVRPPIPAAMFNFAVQLAAMALAWLAAGPARRFTATVLRMRGAREAEVGNGAKPLLGVGFPARRGFLLACIAAFIAAADLWNFGRPARMLWGLPDWLWYHGSLTAALAPLFALASRSIRGQAA